MNQNKKAFTLIELLVVVLIIGILSAVALPQYQASVEKARAAEVFPILKHAEQMYEVQWLADAANVDNVKPQDIMDLNDGKWNSSGTYYCTKYFLYQFSSLSTMVYRCTPNSACSGCSTTNLYNFYVRNRHHEDYGDETPCRYLTSVGEKVCNSFVGLIPIIPYFDE